MKGRPPLKSKKRRNWTLQVYFDAAEQAKIRRFAEKAKLELSVWARRRLLGIDP